MYFMDCDGVSHLGTSKKVNEDRFVIADVRPVTTIRKTNLDLNENTIRKGRPYGNYILVSDGLGDPDDAARASTIAMDCFVRSLMDELQWSLPLDSAKQALVSNQLADAFELCQSTIFREARVLDESRSADMSASVALAWVGWPQLAVATAGTCRVLLVRNQKLVFCSQDDDRFDSKGHVAEYSSVDPAASSARSVYLEGLSIRLVPTIRFVELEIGDAIAVCTDGVTNSLSNERLIEILSSPVSASEACQAIVNDALRISGADSVTVVVAKIHGSETEERQAEKFAELPKSNVEASSNETNRLKKYLPIPQVVPDHIVTP